MAVVHAELNGGDNAKETLIVAPLKGGGWRIWLALKPTPSAPTTPGGGIDAWAIMAKERGLKLDHDTTCLCCIRTVGDGQPESARR